MDVERDSEMSYTMWKYPPAVAAMVLFMSCHAPQREPLDSDVMGSWSGTFEKAGGDFTKASPPTIMFRGDHSFQAHNIPVLNGNTDIPKMFNFMGSWKIQRKTGKSYQVLLDYELNGEHWGRPLSVANTRKGFELELGIDPNEDTKVLFYKSKNEATNGSKK